MTNLTQAFVDIFTNLSEQLCFAMLLFDLQLCKCQICHTKSSPQPCLNQLLDCQLYGGCLVGVGDVVEGAEVGNTLLKIKRDEHRVDIRAKGDKIPSEHEAILKFTNAAKVHFEIRATLNRWLPARLRDPNGWGRTTSQKHTQSDVDRIHSTGRSYRALLPKMQKFAARTTHHSTPAKSVHKQIKHHETDENGRQWESVHTIAWTASESAKVGNQKNDDAQGPPHYPCRHPSHRVCKSVGNEMILNVCILVLHMLQCNNIHQHDLKQNKRKYTSNDQLSTAIQNWPQSKKNTRRKCTLVIFLLQQSLKITLLYRRRNTTTVAVVMAIIIIQITIRDLQICEKLGETAFERIMHACHFEH